MSGQKDRQMYNEEKGKQLDDYIHWKSNGQRLSWYEEEAGNMCCFFRCISLAIKYMSFYMNTSTELEGYGYG